MKIRYLLLLTVLVIAMSSLFSLNAFAESTSDLSETPEATQGLAYTLSDDGTYYTCSGIGTATGTDIVIANEIDGIPVTKIDFEAFSSNKTITRVTIPYSVTSIEYGAFESCISLTSVEIGNSVTSIGSSAFCDCSSLTSVTIPDSVTSIGLGAFSGCISLTSVTIPDSVTSIGLGAFSYCTSLTSIMIPDSVTSIGGAAFFGCDSLTSVNIGNGVTYIGINAFASCLKITNITIPDSVTTIDNGAFYECSKLANVTLGISVETISQEAFEYCTSLISITIPSSVTSVEYGAFRHCSALTDVYYTGTEEQWNAIEIGRDNTPLMSATIHYNEPSEPDVPVDPEPEDPAPEEPSDKYREIFIVEEALYTREWIYQILNRPIDYVKYNITGNQIEFEFSYSDMTSSYIRTLLTSYIDLSFDGVYLVRGDTRFKIVEDKYYSISDNIDGLCLSYVENQSICSLYYEGTAFSEISFPIRDVAKIAIEKSYSDSYNNFDVYLQFNDGTTTFFEFSSVLPKVEGKTFAGFYIYDPENKVNVGDYIPCDGEFHDVNQSGDFALNTHFVEYKSDFAVNFMNWSGTFTVRSFPFYTDLDYVIVTKDKKGITVEHYTPGADGELYVCDTEFFDDDTYVGIQKKPNRANNFVEDDQFPLHIYISDKDVTYYLAPPDYEYLYDIYLGHETSKDNEELMDSISDALADLELPDTGDFSLQIDAIFDNSGYYRYMDIFKNILEFDLFTSLLVVSFVMAMAGYVLFGKRG